MPSIGASHCFAHASLLGLEERGRLDARHRAFGSDSSLHGEHGQPRGKSKLQPLHAEIQDGLVGHVGFAGFDEAALLLLPLQISPVRFRFPSAIMLCGASCQQPLFWLDSQQLANRDGCQFIAQRMLRMNVVGLRAEDLFVRQFTLILLCAQGPLPPSLRQWFQCTGICHPTAAASPCQSSELCQTIGRLERTCICILSAAKSAELSVCLRWYSWNHGLIHFLTVSTEAFASHDCGKSPGTAFWSLR